MADENVVQLPTLLDRLADKLRDYLGRDAKNRSEWIDIQEGICLTLAEARGEFPADIEFGQWCTENGFGDNVINRNDRAAAIQMGAEPQALRACLETTDRRSLRYIYMNDFDRFHQIVKPPSRRKQNKLPIGGKPSKQFEKAKAAVDELQATGKPVSVRAVAEAAGVSDTPARIAVAFKRAEAELDPLTPSEMRTTMRKRYELTVKQARAEIREELRAAVYKELDVYVRHIKERSDRADRILTAYKGVMSRDTFRKIKACLHPDHNTFKFAAEALQAFAELEAVLVKPDDPVYVGPPLPTTAAELMARRKR